MDPRPPTSSLAAPDLASSSRAAHPGAGLPPGVELAAAPPAETRALPSPEALAFVAALERRFGPRRLELLERRRAVQARLDDGWRPDFPDETRALRESEWRVAPPPADLLDRRVEITGPVDRKMVVNAMNSGARVFMADFEDATAPTWENLLEGQQNLHDAIRRAIDFEHPETGKRYALAERTATLMVRPRGWHLPERHVLVDGRPASGALFDFGLFLFQNGRELVRRGTAPYLYLPKLESHLEARLWNDVFVFAEEALGVPRGTIRATVLIETVLAAFEMDEILWELREHSAGLNCGRWDYIFSVIKKLRADPGFLLPDRGAVGMDRHFLSSYSKLLIRTCHRRGAHAMGGMAAQIPIKGDEERNARALENVRRDKEREAREGHDGTWVAHPALVPVAREVFDRFVPGPNQIGRLREDVRVGAADLLRMPPIPAGSITLAGLRQNLEVGVRYLAAWLRGTGCVPIHGLMEDAATAEISRAQVWQWIRHGARLEDGRRVDVALVRGVLEEEVEGIDAHLTDGARAASRLPLAAELFERLVTSAELEDFLTLVAYEHIP